jgi:PA14 domain/Family of unknown function (DUF6298)
MGPLRAGSNGRYFADPSGKAVYLTGSHVWENLQDVGINGSPVPFDFNAYLDFLDSRNHNFIRLWMEETPRGESQDSTDSERWAPIPWSRSGTCCAADGGNKFDLNRLNQSFFDRLRQRVQAAHDRGIYVSIMLFNGWSVDRKGLGGHPFTYHPFNARNNINGVNGDPNGNGQGEETHQLAVDGVTNAQKAMIRKAIDTVNDLDNVLYEISNESNADSTSWQYAMIDFIKSYESGKSQQHPVGMTFQAFGGNNDALFRSPADWVSPNQSAPSPYNYMSNPPPANGDKVVLLDTDHLWGEGGDNIWIWKAFARGHNPIFMDGGIVTFPASNDWHNSARDAMGDTLRYAQKVDLRSMTPHQWDIASTGFVLANPGSEYLVLQPGSGAFNVTLGAGTYDAEWFNVGARKTVSANQVSTDGGSRSFTPPFGGAAVLYLRSSNGTPSTPSPGCAEPANEAFTGCYYNDRALGALTTTRTDPQINFDWETNAPAPGVNPDNFSVRWEGNFRFESADYDFKAITDDGMRVYVDGTLVIDSWKPQGTTEITVRQRMTAGTHLIKVEYFEGSGWATAHLAWSNAGGAGGDGTGGGGEASTCPAPADNAFTGCYYADPDLKKLVFTRTDPAIDFSWELGSPDPSVPVDFFSSRWEGKFDFESADYDFTALVDDGIRLYVDDALIIDSWKPQPAGYMTSRKNMTAGSHLIRMEHFEATWFATAKLVWQKR